MSLTPQLQRLATPAGTEFPGNVDDFLQLITEYMEIIGLESFSGINYGSTTPDSSSRSMPWFRLSAGGSFLGWYAWDGSAWSLVRPRFPELTHAQMMAISDPQGGQGVWVVGSAAFKVYDSASGTWKRAIPETDTINYDRTYLFDHHQLLAAPSTASGGWIQVDLTSYKNSAGLNGKTLKAAIVRLEASYASTFGGPQTYGAALKCVGTNTVSTSATDVLTAYAYAARDDSATAIGAQIAGPVKLTTDSLYYTLSLTTVTTVTASVYLVGFIY